MTPIPRIYHDTIQVVATDPLLEVAAELPTLPLMKSSLYRSRRGRLPPLPQSRAEIHLEGEFLLDILGFDILGGCELTFLEVDILGVDIMVVDVALPLHNYNIVALPLHNYNIV